MKISVVTISFNQAEFLQACIDSVAAQEVPFEHIIVDPGSTDGSRDIIEANRSHFSHIVLEEDDGPADGLNRGFARASGDIFYYLNSDDIVLGGAFKEAATLLAQFAEVGIIYGDGILIAQDGNTIRPVHSARTFTPYRYLTGAAPILQQATFFRKSAFIAAGKFNKNNKTCWDGELLLNIVLAGEKTLHAPRKWGGFRLYADSITGSGRFEERRGMDHNRMFQKVYGREKIFCDRVANLWFRFLNKLQLFVPQFRGIEKS